MSKHKPHPRSLPPVLATPKGRGLDCPTPGKSAYTNRKDARRSLRYIKRKLRDPKAAQVYLCECGAFHIGHSDYAHRSPAHGS